MAEEELRQEALQEVHEARVVIESIQPEESMLNETYAQDEAYEQDEARPLEAVVIIETYSE